MRKLFVLGILVLFLTTTGFSQGLPVPAPLLQLFPHSQWARYGEPVPADLYVPVEACEKLGIELNYVLFVDLNGLAGFVQCLVISKGDKEIILGGWAMPRSALVRGFAKVDEKSSSLEEDYFVDGYFLTKKTAEEGELLLWRDGLDGNGNLLIHFFFFRKEEKRIRRVHIRRIEVKKFIEENFSKENEK